MTILLTEIPTYVTYTAAAGQTYFTFPMPFWANSDITVVKNLVVLTQGSQYYVLGAQQQTGMSMTLTTPANSGDIITISRYVPYERVANYPLTGPMRIESINIEQAKHVAMMQQLRDGLRNHEQRLSLIEGGGGGGGGSGFATFYINDQPPPNPFIGMGWWESDSGALYVYYDDGSGNPQWVQIGSGADATAVFSRAKQLGREEGVTRDLVRREQFVLPAIDPGKGVTGSLRIEGAAYGDFVEVAMTSNQFDVMVHGWVSNPDEVSVRFTNMSSATRELGSVGVRIRVSKAND